MANIHNEENTSLVRNPYIIGTPIDDPKKLFGRDSLFNFIKDNLDNDIKLILLHGLRRIGKSSVLQQFSHFVTHDSLVCVNFDLQDQTTKSLSQILQSLATSIVEQLDLETKGVNVPDIQEFEDEVFFLRNFLPQVYEKLGNKRIVLLLDEFDVVQNSTDADTEIVSKGSDFFQYLKRSLVNQDKLFIIPVVGRNVAELESMSTLFHNAPTQEIGLLDEISAKRLITKLAEGILTYETEAQNEIYKLCAGHPYFTQVVCFKIFEQARAKNLKIVNCADVNAIVEQAINAAEGGLAWFWEGLSIPQQVIFLAVAEAQYRSGDSLPDKGPIEILKEYGVIQTEELIQAVDQLVQKSWLDNTKRRVKVELVRCWLMKKYSLKEEIGKLENLNLNQIKSLCEKASELHRNGKNNEALHVYETILDYNPNHYSSILALGDVNLEIGNFDRSIELYERAYKLNSSEANKKVFIDVLESYGEQLISQRNLPKAKAQFQLVLDYEPNRGSAKHKIEEIDGYQIATNSSSVLVNHSNNSSRINRNLKTTQQLAIVAGIVALLGVGGLIVNRSLTSCPEGQEKRQFSLFCSQNSLPNSRNDIDFVSGNISNGNRILLSETNNSSDLFYKARLQGIQAFINKQYDKAYLSFKVARQANRNDPEVLIYQNNAKIYQIQQEHLTLAVVVPVYKNQSFAEEILRGVAQAQDKFNRDGGFNGRLLEIVIANDADEPEKAKQIAEQLAKKEEILGVIGHYSSKVTEKVLEKYKLANLPIISPTSTSINLKNEVFFRTVSSDAEFGKKLADYASLLGLNQVVILYDSKSSDSLSLETMFEQEFQKLKGNFETIDFRTPNQDIKTKLINTLKSSKAKGVLLFPDSDHISLSYKLVKDEELKMQNIQFLGGDTLYSSEAFTAEGLIVAVPWFRRTPDSEKFAREALKYWGNEVSWRTATSFDATQAFIEAFSTFSSKFSRPELLSKLKEISINPKETAGYPLKFAPDGETMSKPILVKVKGGNFTLIP